VKDPSETSKMGTLLTTAKTSLAASAKKRKKNGTNRQATLWHASKAREKKKQDAPGGRNGVLGRSTFIAAAGIGLVLIDRRQRKTTATGERRSFLFHKKKNRSVQKGDAGGGGGASGGESEGNKQGQ